jgi:transcriptional regulator with XRE-family HTH domain
VPRARNLEPLTERRLVQLLARAATSLAVNLRERRELSGSTQEALAERAGLSTIYLQALERGDAANPSLRVVVSLAHALGCEPGELLAPRKAIKPRKVGRPRRPPSSQ